MPPGSADGQLHQADVLGQQSRHQREHRQRRHVAGHPHGDQALGLRRQQVIVHGHEAVEVAGIPVGVQLHQLPQIRLPQPGRKEHDPFQRLGARVAEQAAGEIVPQRPATRTRAYRPAMPDADSGPRRSAPGCSPAGWTPCGPTRSTLIGFPSLGQRCRRSRGLPLLRCGGRNGSSSPCVRTGNRPRPASRLGPRSAGRGRDSWSAAR